MTPSRRGHPKLKAVAVALAILLIGTVAVELLLRAIVGLGSPLLFVYDPACGYLPRPNQHLHRFFVRTDINRYGMRCADFDVRKRPGTMRLLFVGDSIVYGTTQVGQNQIFASIVGRELPAKLGKAVDELNASAGGWSIENEAGFLASRGTFDSDYVLLVLNSGDMAQRSSSLAEVGGEAVTHGRLALAELFERVRALLTWRLNKLDPGTAVGTDPVAEQMNKANLSRIKETVGRDHSRLVILFVPFRIAVRRGATKSATPSLLAWAHDASVPLIDTTAAVSPYPVDSIDLSDRTHYNTKGNRILATAIETDILPLLSH